MKRPAFQFYPADWRKDSALQSCSLMARGLWMEMICIMHENMPYGYLVVNGKSMKLSQLARLVGEQEKIVEELLAELEEAGVFERNTQGCVFSRRMVRDEDIRNKRAEGGKLGGNPHLSKKKVSQEDKQADNLENNQRINHSDNLSAKQKVNSKVSRKDNLEVNHIDNLPPNQQINQAANLSLTPSSSSSSSVSSSSSISSLSAGSSSSSMATSVEIYPDPVEMPVSQTGRDDDCPLKPEEWAEYFAKREGERPKIHSFFSAWCAAKISTEQVEQAIHTAQEKSSEPVVCLPAYVNQVLTSNSLKRGRHPSVPLGKQTKLEAHNAQIASKWLNVLEIKNA